MRFFRLTAFTTALLLVGQSASLDQVAPTAAQAQAKKVAPPRAVIAQPAVRGPGVEQQQILVQQALESALDGELDNALQTLGQFADLPQAPQPFWREPQLGAALANVLRLASDRTADERYELWKTWTLPNQNQDRQAVRILTGLTSPNTAPAAFRQLAWTKRSGQPAGAAATIPDVISTADLLIDAAREAKRLDELAAALKDVAANKTERAEMLAALVALARGSDAAAAQLIREQIADRQKRRGPQADVAAIPRENWLLARGCIAQGGELQLLGEQHLRQIIEYWRRLNHIYQLPILYHDLHQSQARRAAAAGLSNPADPGLELWHPASHASADRRRFGEVSPWWIAHDGIIASLGGREFDMLYFDYPLTGNFDFSIEALDGDWDEGNVSYAGMILEAVHGVQVPWLYPVGLPEWLQLPETIKRRGEFNAITLQVREGYVRCLLNDHIVHELEDPSRASPWLALYVPQAYHATLRNWRLTGDVKIPREVTLVDGNHLEGWISRYYDETQTSRLGPAAQGPAAERVRGGNHAVWSAQEGVISGGKLPAAGGAIRQSRLFYHRPLRAGDSVQYEFLYEPDRTEIHPAIDRLTFLLNPDGVRMHWMTDNNGTDPWSGLPAGNSVDEAENRRGPRELPLKAGEWNKVRLTLQNELAILELNGVEIYQRKIEPSNDRLFGFYHDAAKTVAKARAVVLTGCWPEKLTQGQQAHLFALCEPLPSKAERRSRHAAIGEQLFASNWEEIQRQAIRRSDAEAYSLLKQWVLPADDHPTYRLDGGMTQTNPAPVGNRLNETKQPRNGKRIETGGEPTAPALDLIAVAGRLGRLDELRALVEESPGETGHDRRGRLVLQALIALARRDDAAALAALQELQPLFDHLDAGTPEWMRWPEYLAASMASRSPALWMPVRDLAETLALRDRGRLLSPAVAMRAALRGRVRSSGPVSGEGSASANYKAVTKSAHTLKQWAVVTHGTAQSQAYGIPNAEWRTARGSVQHVAGHNDDYLYFQSPLHGNFEVACQLNLYDGNEMHVAYADTFVAIRPKQSGYELTYHDGGEPFVVTVDPPLANLGEWCNFSLKLHDANLTMSINGQEVHSEPLPADCNPWLAIHSPALSYGTVRDLRITGIPVVPERLVLIEEADLAGWTADYFGPSFSGNQPEWKNDNREIVGRKNEQIAAGSRRQSLLRYKRPLLEDGELEYEFYFEPGEAHVHPALDRLAFLLLREGVKIHWLTDAPYDRTGLAHDNALDEPAQRRGPARLPLVSNDWNRVRLSLQGDEVSVRLNDVEVYRRALEPTNLRTFGLFHYADESQARVRKIVYRGGWPRAIPAVADQELALPLAAEVPK